MAQTRKRRRTKHRGNAAGVVEARGRTGRKPTAAERRPAVRDEARQRRLERLDRPPTWRSATNRAGVAVGIFVLVLVLLFRQSLGASLGLAAFALAIYIPMGYYTDLFIYRRRQAKKQGK
jgi:hypothetical protein